MKEVWLAKDEAYVVFDTKPMSELMGFPKSDWAKVVQLTDEEYEKFDKVTKDYYAFQEFLKRRMQ